jgi:aryl-alcohol dehydrogenase-like predicted oxidoreductase
MNNDIVATMMTQEMQYALLEAFEQGTDQALVHDWLSSYPTLADDIIEFATAMYALGGPDIAPDPELDAAIERGIALGMQRAGITMVTLSDALQAEHIKKTTLARQLRLGVDVLDAIMHARITRTSIPFRFIEQVGQALHTTVSQVQSWLDATYATDHLAPALRRDRADASATESNSLPLTFQDAIEASLNMSDSERASWQRL